MKSAIINRRMARALLIAILMMVCTNSVQAQQTTLTVDCQTPGWLSSKIGYKDQLSVKNLTVTGYLNLTDMSFLAGLTEKNLIHLDMSGVEMIEHGDNYQGKRFSNKLQYISLPNNDNNLKKYYSGSKSGVIDSVFINSKGILKMYELGSTAKYLHIGEGIDSIYVNDARCSGFKKIHLPSTVHYLERGFYYYADYRFIRDTIDINLENIENFEETSIQAYIRSDTIRFSPKLKKWKTNAFGIKENSVIYLPADLEYINDYQDKYEQDHQIDGRRIEFYCKMQTPPKVRKYNFNNHFTSFRNCIVHVPIGCSEIYKKTDPWSAATIVEDKVAVTGIELDQSSISLTEIGENVQLTANVLPHDATNKNVRWSSSNPSVAIVSKGNVVCVGYGTAVILATTEDGGFMATCVVNVASGIEGIENNKNVKVSEGAIALTNMSKGTLIRLTDMSGKIIYQKRLQDGDSFTTPQFTKGIYILSVGSQNYKLAIP